jgi:hypothetical protein
MTRSCMIGNLLRSCQLLVLETAKGSNELRMSPFLLIVCWCFAVCTGSTWQFLTRNTAMLTARRLY